MTVLYVVHRVGSRYSKVVRKSEEHGERAQGRAVGAFLDRQQAEAFRRDLETQVTPDGDPFDYANFLWEMTSMDEDVFADVLLDLGVDPPAKVEDDWREWDPWWLEQWPKLNGEQQKGIWRHLDLIQFYQIVEVPLSEGATSTLDAPVTYHPESQQLGAQPQGDQPPHPAG